MINLRQVAQQALEFLESGNFVYPTQLAIDLRKALAQPEQKPVAWMSDKGSVASMQEKKMGYVLESAFTIPLYTTPPAAQRPWIGLTDEDLEFWTEELGQGELGKGVIRAVADHLKERNT
jgi:hypothetical protein